MDSLHAIEHSRWMLERAIRMKESGQCEWFTVFVLESDPRIIDHIYFHKPERHDA